MKLRNFRQAVGSTVLLRKAEARSHETLPVETLGAAILAFTLRTTWWFLRALRVDHAGSIVMTNAVEE